MTNEQIKKLVLDYADMLKEKGFPVGNIIDVKLSWGRKTLGLCQMTNKGNYIIRISKYSDVDTMERIEIIRDLRSGVFDVLVGINLLREGLDIPECSLVAILDADKEGFLRSYRSLIQTIGRAARNAEGRVVLYADKITDSIKKALDETERRRKKQYEYNKKYGITPRTIKKEISNTLMTMTEND